LLSFARKNELFGDYPEVELERQQDVRLYQEVISGYSNMYTDSYIEALDNIIGKKGQVSYGLIDDSLLIRVEKTQRLNRRFSTMVYIFGYNYKIPFAKMPKIRIMTKYNKFKVFDGNKMINPEGMTLNLSDKELILHIPLKTLNDPDFILTSVKTYAGILPIDSTSFRKIKIK
jgi:hypothetical protein